MCGLRLVDLVESGQDVRRQLHGRLHEVLRGLGEAGVEGGALGDGVGRGDGVGGARGGEAEEEEEEGEGGDQYRAWKRKTVVNVRQKKEIGTVKVENG